MLTAAVKSAFHLVINNTAGYMCGMSCRPFSGLHFSNPIHYRVWLFRLFLSLFLFFLCLLLHFLDFNCLIGYSVLLKYLLLSLSGCPSFDLLRGCSRVISRFGTGLAFDILGINVTAVSRLGFLEAEIFAEVVSREPSLHDL
jgi:hypothetical protein